MEFVRVFGPDNDRLYAGSGCVAVVGIYRTGSKQRIWTDGLWAGFSCGRESDVLFRPVFIADGFAWMYRAKEVFMRLFVFIVIFQFYFVGLEI